MKRRFDSLPSKWPAFLVNDGTSLETDSESQQQTSKMDHEMLPLGEQAEVECYNGSPLQIPSAEEGFVADKYLTSTIYTPDDDLDSNEVYVATNENSQTPGSTTEGGETYYYFVEEDEEIEDDGNQHDSSDGIPLPPGCLPEDMPSPLPVAPNPFVNSLNETNPQKSNDLNNVPLPACNDNFKNDEEDSQIIPPLPASPPPLPPNDHKDKTHSKLDIKDEKSISLPHDVMNKMDPQFIALPPGPNRPEEKSSLDDNARYSPSKTESDDETVEATTAKPKVLNKNQAKQRLMAFSLSKQGNTNSPTKKINKVSPNVPKTNKEKPPNPNKSAGVQEQFRATVSAIEEEKKRMFSDKPNYLLNEKLMNFARTGSMGKDGNTDSMKFSDSNRKRRNSRRRSNSRKRSKSRSRSRRRSTSKTRKRNKSRSRSRSKRRSRSRSRRRDRDKNDKSKDGKEEKDKKTEKKEDVSTKIKELPNDWDGFNAAKLTPGPHLCRLKMDLEDRVKRRDYQTRIKSEREEYKPIFNYLKKGLKLMNEFRPRPKDPNNKTDTVYGERIIKYTLEKPMIMYAENPAHATEFCMPLKMLLENCDSNTSQILSFIIENKESSLGLLSPGDLPKERLWYPQRDYLVLSEERLPCPEVAKEIEPPVEKKSEKKDKEKLAKKSIEVEKVEPEIKKRERKISLVNDDYLSESDREVKEGVVEEPKIELDSKTKLVKVRSRWDSDDEYESAKEEPEPIKEEDMEISSSEEHVEAPIITEEIQTPVESVKVVPFPGLDPMKLLEAQAMDFAEKEIDKIVEPAQSPEHLVSEYEQFEQFVKAVEMEAIEKVKTPESEKIEDDVKGLKVEEEKSEVGEWDEESEDEEKFQKMKMELIEKKSESESEELDSSAKSKKIKKKLAVKKKKVMKIKKKKPKVIKKVVKDKKKKKKASSSESSSRSSDSGSESSSSEDDKKKKKNKKKIVKKKKKDSQSGTESDSDDNKKKKKKTKLKKKVEKVKEKGKKKEESPVEKLSGKKHKIAKKTEDIDSGKKKDKGIAKKRERSRSKTAESEERTGKKRKVEEKVKVEKKKKKLKGKAKSEEKITPKKLRRSSSSDKSKKKKKLKKKRESSSSGSSSESSSSSSSDEEEKAVIKSKNEKKSKDSKKKISEKRVKLKKGEKKKKKVSESESDGAKKLKKLKKKKKKKKKSESESSVKSEEKLLKELRLSFERESPAENIPWKGTKRTVICNPDIIKNNLDWEESSEEEEKLKAEESGTESSWDEKTPNSFKVLKEESNKSEIITKKINDESRTSHKSSEALQTPVSGVLLNENSYHSFVPEIFNSERSLSNSFKEIIPTEEIVRPFQSVSQPEMKLPEADLYSPGHTESEPSREQTPVVAEKKEEEVKKEVYDPLNADSESSSDSKIEDAKNVPAPKTPERNSPKVFESPVKVAPSPRFINSFSTVTPALPLSLSNMLENVSSVSENESVCSPIKKVSVKIQPPKVPAIIPTDDSPEREEDVKKTDEKGKYDDKRGRDKERYDESRKRHSERSRDDSRERDSDRKRRRSRSRERRSEDKSKDSRRRDNRRSRTPEKRYRSGDDFQMSDSPPRDSKSENYKQPQPKVIKGTEFDVAPLKETIQPIPVLTGVDPSHVDWERESDYNHSDFPIENYKQYDKQKERRSRSRSLSPRRKRRSKSPEVRKRSPRRRSISPRKRRSPSPRRRSPPRRRRSSRSPDRRRRSRSRSPRKKRGSPRRSRSSSPRRRRDSPRRSTSPKKDSYYSVTRNRIPVIGGRSDGLDVESSPNLVVGSPMGFSKSLADSTISDSELNNAYYNREYSGDFIPGGYPDEISTNNLITLRNHDLDEKSTDSPKRLSLDQRIELELGVNLRQSSSAPNEPYPSQPYQEFQEPHPPQYPNTYNCDNNSSSNASNATFYPNPDFNGQFYNGPPNHGHYPQYPPTHPPHPSIPSHAAIPPHASIPPHPHGAHPLHPPPHPVIPSQVPMHPSQIPHPPHPPIHPSQIPPSPHPAQPLHRPPNQSAVLQVGNIMEVVPTIPVPGGPPSAPVGAKNPQIMQVGNVLQVVPNNKPPQGSLPPPQVFGNAQAPVKGQKATAVVAPSSVVSTTSPEVFLDPLIKAIQLEREKRKKEREKRKTEREARRRARQLKREAKMMSVEEKLKKSVQYEGLMLGQEVEDEELLDALEPPSPIPVEIITVSQDTLPPAGKGILVTEGFGSRPPSEKKEVKFADGICPGDGTSTSGGEASPPPKPRLPKEKRFKKKKTKLKKKVKVHIIRQVIQDDDDEDDDDLSPPPPPPGDPPPVFFAKFPFGSQAQYPVYHTQTTTTTLTTVQFPPQSFQ